MTYLKKIKKLLKKRQSSKCSQIGREREREKREREREKKSEIERGTNT